MRNCSRFTERGFLSSIATDTHTLQLRLVFRRIRPIADDPTDIGKMPTIFDLFGGNAEKCVTLRESSKLCLEAKMETLNSKRITKIEIKNSLFFFLETECQQKYRVTD